MSSIQRLVVQPSPWLPGSCVTQDMPVSNGIWLNQSLPFNITSSNTVFLFNCSPRLLVSPLNCTSSSICHHYLESSGHVDTKRALECASDLHPCCTFVAGGVPSAYKIRLHNSGCKAFRSILHLDQQKPANQWEEGLEIQWTPPPEPVCMTQRDCSGDSKCSPAVLAIITKYCKLSSNREKKQAKEREVVLKSSAGEKPYKMFQLKDVKKATNGFSQDRILGSGGFGEVYRGELQDGTLVAVKKAKVGNLKSTQQVLNEVAILSQVNHKNLVRLLGCCVESEQPLMIYEYISNGTLYDHVHGRYSNFLDWKTRLKVAFQTAEALAYLHSAAHTPIYHRDVKSTNILLDDEFNAKVSDFGLSRLANPGLSHVSTCAQGTLGYLDPEYYRNYQLTDKSDVYSYGVVLLELLTSQKAIDFTRDQDDVNLAIHVSQYANNGTIMEVVDQRLLSVEPSGDKMITSIKLFSELALNCLKEKKGERPSMRDIVESLMCIIRIVNQE
ncbi:Serine/threonine-protein kinase, active site [Sesbania bispinosa]|nr:Serine/threonine-protein kinase, active site [Sesbania bispinosa]